ncbi:hypothetical protein CHARACLAT_018904 [Characodon lateralis]|uniref:Uncharacterized protein n=1 Tax=Characodon lateralis TaxID=208331 RepID=A0ABU7DHX0_9TELE|nr:hypothetical protein [Characodon lateralis]
MLQPALILGCSSGVPDGDGGGEDGLNDGCVEVHHHSLGRLNFFSCRRKNILCWAFLMRELMFGSHLRSREIVIFLLVCCVLPILRKWILGTMYRWMTVDGKHQKV